MMKMFSLPVLLGLGLGLRLVWALLIPVEPTSDPAVYVRFATNIADHGVYGFAPDEPTAYWAVGTAAIYAGMFTVFGTGSAVGIVAINLLSAMVVIWGLYDIGRRWFDDNVGRLAALLFVFWPMAIQFTTVLASEIHFMATTLLALMAWDRAKRLTTFQFWLWAIAAGLALAGAVYLRPIALLIPAALALAAVLRSPWTSLNALAKAAVATAVIFACVAPWSARNERVFDEPVFMSTNFWANFWMGNHPDTNGEYSPLPESVEGLSEIERIDVLKELSLDSLANDPLGFVVRTVVKAVRLHERETIGVAWNLEGLTARLGPSGPNAVKALSTAYWYVVLGLALIGVVGLVRRRGLWAGMLSEPVWLWLYFTGVHAVIVIGDRYHMPAIPMIALLAAFAVYSRPFGRQIQAS